MRGVGDDSVYVSGTHDSGDWVVSCKRTRGFACISGGPCSARQLTLLGFGKGWLAVSKGPILIFECSMPTKGQGFIRHLFQRVLRLGTAEKLGPLLLRLQCSQYKTGESFLILMRQRHGSFKSLLKELCHLSNASLSHKNSECTSPLFLD